MSSVVLVIHLFLALAIIALVLMQRSEGGGLGIGGGGGGLGGLATPQSTGNALTKATAICAGCFFLTSLLLAILAGAHRQPASILDELDPRAASVVATEGEVELPEVIPERPPQVPVSE